MTSDTEFSSKNARDNEDGRPGAGIAFRKVWLPRALYQSLPYFYIVAGIAAAIGTAYISDWFWAVPHYVLFAAGCVHFGVIVTHKRRRARRRRLQVSRGSANPVGN